mmetsp:Transcript_13438/g.34431  ORF Transcript_13438/g.34431 Transcript_13438/m.34431 type:complete len:221 (+) Transcript_13438:1158-1820(+)
MRRQLGRPREVGRHHSQLWDPRLRPWRRRPPERLDRPRGRVHRQSQDNLRSAPRRARPGWHHPLGKHDPSQLHGRSPLCREGPGWVGLARRVHLAVQHRGRGHPRPACGRRDDRSALGGDRGLRCRVRSVQPAALVQRALHDRRKAVLRRASCCGHCAAAQQRLEAPPERDSSLSSSRRVPTDPVGVSCRARLCAGRLRGRLVRENATVPPQRSAPLLHP